MTADTNLSDVVTRLKRDGFCLHRITDAAQQNVNDMIVAALSFFRMPLDEKIFNRLPHEMGYRPMGIEYSQSPAYPDQVESFSVNPRIASRLLELPSATARDLCRLMLGLYEILESIAEVLVIHLADKMAGDFAGSKLRGAFHNWSRLQLNYARPADVALPHINEAHEDGDLITIAWASGPGLEVQMPDGEFTPLTTASEEMLVMPGEIAWLLSGGQIRPLYHRVRPVIGQTERMAVLFFGDIDPIFCQPWVLNEVNRNIDIKSRILTSIQRFGLKGFTPDY